MGTCKKAKNYDTQTPSNSKWSEPENQKLKKLQSFLANNIYLYLSIRKELQLF